MTASDRDTSGERTESINGTNRRRFLKASGALTAAGIVAGCLGGGDGGDGSDGGDDSDGGGDGGDGGSTPMGTAGGLETFENEAGVKVGATWEAVQALAAEEDAAVIYGTIDRKPFHAWAEKARETHPDLQVDVITGGSEDLLARWTTEYKSGNVQADAYISTSSIVPTWKNGQVLELSGEFMPSFAAAPDKFKSDEGNWIATRQVLGNIFYNTNAVSASDASNWMDVVTNPAWADGKIGWDPTPNMFLMSWLFDTQGEAFFEELRSQKPRWVDSHTDLARLCGAGEFPVAMTYTHKMGRFGNKLPLDYFKFDPTPSVISPAVISNKSPSPNSAIVFMNWLTSKGGQQFMGTTPYIPWHPEADYTAYPNVYPSPKYDVDTISPSIDIEGTQQKWKEIMGDLIT